VNAATPQRGFSPTADSIAEMRDINRKHLASSAVLGKQTALIELASVWEECQHPNWDGYNALAVQPETLINTYHFVESLPLGYPLPSISAEPDGHMALEWYQNPSWTLSVSVSPESDLYYAALFGANTVRGSEVFHDDVPRIILGLIQRVHAG